MPKNTTLRVLNPLLALLMISQLLSGLMHPCLSPEAFAWLHARGGLALLVAFVLHVAANRDWLRTAGCLSGPRAKARSCPDPQEAASK